jgi:hypothetical protein
MIIDAQLWLNSLKWKAVHTVEEAKSANDLRKVGLKGSHAFVFL